MSFSPAGYEDDFYDDEDDYDGFSFGEPSPASVKATTESPMRNVVFMPAGGEENDEDDLDFGEGSKVVWNNSPPQNDSEGMKSSRKRPGSASSNKRVRFDDKRKTSPTKLGGSVLDQKPGADPISEDDFRAAVMRGSVSTVEKFIEQGADIDRVMRSGWTPIMYSSSAGNPSMCELLLSKGANPNFQKDMYSVLMAACSSNNRNEPDVLKCVDLLLDRGARIKAFDKYRMSPMMYATLEGHAQVVERLIQKGVDVNEQDSRGWTPLCFASSRGHVQIVKILLESNANSKIVATDGQSPSDIAYSSGFSGVSELLEATANPEARMNGNNVSSAFTADAPVESSKHAGSYVRYGDLEIFLAGLELGSLIQVFQDHQISFEALLRMTDEDLQQVGISQVGIRKKILEAINDVHTKEWNMGSFIQQTNKKTMKAQDVSLILANASKHLQYIKSSTLYVKKYLHSVKDVQEITQDLMEAQQMVDQTQEATKIAISLKNELLSLNLQISEISSKVAKTSPDLIQDDEEIISRGRRWTRYIVLSAAAATMGAILISSKVAKTSPDLIQDDEEIVSRGRRWTRYIVLSAAAATMGAILVRKYTLTGLLS